MGADFEKKKNNPASILVPKKNSCTRPLPKKIHARSLRQNKHVIRRKHFMHKHVPRKIFLSAERF